MSIVLERLTKRYDGHPVVNNISLEISDGEFFVLLGSSGSGKTTVLSLIAGLVPVDEGRVWLHGRDVTELRPQERRVGFVFQNYALFQHMTVGENIEFGLSVRKVGKQERGRRRDELLELVGLSGLGTRMPRQLSGGQQQRVALARALAHGPEVLLLDEPLGALDAKIRMELRRTLRAIQRQLGVTTILVTHDQEEAFDLADRIGVMSFGRLLEVGAPEELYQRPQTEFVASFLGVANLMVGTATHTSVQLGGVQFPMQNGYQPSRTDLRVQVLFRPEDVALVSEAGELDCPNLGQACVEEVSFGGSIERLRLRLPPIPGVRPISPPVPFGGESLLVEATRPPDQASRFSLQPGDRAWIGVRRIHALTHPGLSILIATDGSLRSQAAITLGGGIARLANARVTLLGCGGRGEAFERYLQEARKQIGGGLASLEVCSPVEPSLTGINQVIERQPYDLVILGFDPSEHLALAEGILQNGDHHLLLVTGPHSLPTHALVCVSSGEPGKDDVLFAGRLIRHLCADATLLTILDGGDSRDPYRAERFLAGGVKSLSLLGVTASPEIRTGDPGEEILAALKAGGYDLLIMGTPLANSTGEISFNGLIGNVLKNISSVPVLIVRSHFIGARHLAARHKDFPLVSE